MFHIDTIKVVSLMQHIQENIHFKAGHLRNITVAGQKFKNIPVYERGGKGIQFFLKEYQNSLPEEEGSVGFQNFHDIVELLIMRGESKSILYTYYIKFRHGKIFLIIGLIGLEKCI